MLYFKKRTSIIILAMSVLLVCCALIYFTPMQRAKAEGSFDPASIEDDCARLSNTDLLEGAIAIEEDRIPTISDYIDNIDKAILLGDYSIHSDWLYRIIPLELFINECEYYHSGKAYSYYIKTFGNEQLCRSIVFLIEHTPKYEEEFAQVSLRLRLFQSGYETKPSQIQNGHVSFQNSFAFGNFYLKDVQFYIGVENEHTLNYGDDGYSKNQDDGVVLTQTRCNYKGFYTDTEKGTVLPLLEKTVDALLGVAELAMPELKVPITFYKGLKDIHSWAEAISSCYSHSVRVDSDNDNENNIVQYQTKASQLSNDYPYPYLLKFGTVAPDIGTLISDYAEIKAVFSDSRPETRVHIGVYFNILFDPVMNDLIIIDSSGIGATYNADFESDPNAYMTAYPPHILSYDKLLFEETSTVECGENDGYLLRDDSEQVFEFTPEKTAKYSFDVGEKCKIKIVGSDESEDWHIGCFETANVLEAGKKYKICVQPKTGAKHLSYKLNIGIVTKELTVETSNVGTVGGETVNRFFIPSHSDAYRFALNGTGAFETAIYDESGTELARDGDAIDIYLTAGKRYDIELVNNNSYATTVDLTLSLAPTLMDDGSRYSANKHAIYRIELSHNGEYEINFGAEQALARFYLRDMNFGQMHRSMETTATSYSTYLTAGVYYIEVGLTYGAPLNHTTSLRFAPPVISGAQTTATDKGGYNVYRFTPNGSGRYAFTLGGALRVYDGDGNDVTGNILFSGSDYYIKANGSGTLTTTLAVDGTLELAEPTTASAGVNVFLFAPTVSGDYVFDGGGAFTVLDGDFSLVGGAVAALAQGNSYYISVTTPTTQAIEVCFDPDEICNYGSIMVYGTTYRKLTVREVANYSIDAKKWGGGSVPLALYNNKLVLISSADNAISAALSVGVYFIKVTDERNIGVCVSVNNDNQADSIVNCIIGTEYEKDILQGDSASYKLDMSTYDKPIILNLQTNMTINEQSDIDLTIYRLVNGVRVNVTLYIDDIGKYNFIAENTVIFIEFLARGRQKDIVFSITENVQITDVAITVNGIENSDVFNKKVLAIGRTYGISVAIKDPELCSAIVTLSAPSGVMLANGVLSVPYNENIVGGTVTITIGTDLTLETIILEFDIVAPYTVGVSLSATELTVNIKDYLGKAINDGERTVKISYIETLADGTSSTVVIAENAVSVDIAKLPTVGAVKFKVDVKFKEPSHTKTVVTTKTDFSKYCRRDYSAKTSVTETIRVSKNISMLNIRGKIGCDYTLNIVIESEMTALTVNLIDLKFRSEQTPFDAAKVGSLTLNIYGNVNILAVGNNGKSAVSAKNINIIGKTTDSSLYLLGAAKFADFAGDVAGSALKASGKTVIENIDFTALGGTGHYLGEFFGKKNGAIGGSGVDTNTIDIKNSTVKISGGDGGIGASGAAGADGLAGTQGSAGKAGAAGKVGADGGTALFLGVSDGYKSVGSFVSLCGGKGGNGGSGGKGGNGGNSTGSGKVGGAGGRGGDGGAYGNGGKASNYNVSATTAADGITGYGGQGGVGGKGGNGGKGANGGQGGAGGDSYFFGYKAIGGQGGAGGSGGSAGKNGAEGAYLPYTYIQGYTGTLRFTFYTYTPIELRVSGGGNVNVTVFSAYSGTSTLLSSGTGSVRFTAYPANNYTIEITLKNYANFQLYISG